MHYYVNVTNSGNQRFKPYWLRRNKNLKVNSAFLSKKGIRLQVNSKIKNKNKGIKIYYRLREKLTNNKNAP